MRENTNQKKLRIWTLLTQWSLFQYSHKSGKSQSEPSEFSQALKNNLSENITGRGLESIQ